jgi:hypothetical protein
MKYLLLLLCCVAGCVTASNAQYNKANLKLGKPAGTTNAYLFKNLQLYPIRANDVFRAHHRNNAKYVTLKEALEKNKVEITETSEGTVNTLYIENTSRDTIIVLSGEVVKGGKQDRVIAQDFVLYPRSGKKDISVFCVEHGRWQAKEDGAAFKEYYSISSNEVRKAATVKKNQGEVWSKVAETTSKNQANTSTGTLTALKNSGSYSADLKKYIDHFQPLLAQDANVIGVVAVSGNTILGCDMFASHDIFVTYLPNLLNSYATEAITTGSVVNVPYEKVKDYLDGILKDESKQEKEVPKNGAMLKDGDKKIHISTF